MAYTLLLLISNKHVTALWFNLIARILLYNDTNTNPNASIVLLSYRSCILLPYESNKPYTNTHTDRQALYYTALQPNNLLRRYTYNPNTAR